MKTSALFQLSTSFHRWFSGNFFQRARQLLNFLLVRVLISHFLTLPHSSTSLTQKHRKSFFILYYSNSEMRTSQGAGDEPLRWNRNFTFFICREARSVHLEKQKNWRLTFSQRFYAAIFLEKFFLLFQLLSHFHFVGESKSKVYHPLWLYDSIVTVTLMYSSFPLSWSVETWIVIHTQERRDKLIEFHLHYPSANMSSISTTINK